MEDDMLKKQLTFIIIPVLILALAAPMVYAQRGVCTNDGPGIMRAADELKLTDDQLAQMQTIRNDRQMKLIDVNANLKKARLQLRELWQQGIPSENDVGKIIDKVASLNAQKQKINATYRINEMKVLTSDQLAQLKKMRMNHRSFRGCSMRNMRERGFMKGDGMGDMPCPGHAPFMMGKDM
jgi:Spy/CpxP family protein refolding chaperone